MPYVNTGMYCAVSDDLYEGGEGCGRCYRIWYDGCGGTDPATAGTADIQVVNSGAGGVKHFDCFDTAHQALTGTSTGIFPITFMPIDCTYSTPTAVVLDGNNKWYVKMLFVGGKTGVMEAKIILDGIKIDMERVGVTGTWSASTAAWAQNNQNSNTATVDFVMVYSDGTQAEFYSCFNGQWSVPTGSQCEAGIARRKNLRGLV